MVEKTYVTYNDVHKLCQASAERILNDFRPNLMIAIGGGGYVPARILRSFLKRPGNPNIPIQAIGLSLYEQLPPSTTPSTPSAIPKPSFLPGHLTSNGASSTAASSAPSTGAVTPSDPDIEVPGTKVTRTQWLDLSSLEMANLIGKNVLIVDEVDDTRTTLSYAVSELMKDVEIARRMRHGQGDAAAADAKTTFSIFVLHNKDKEKKASLPKDLVDGQRYMAAVTVPDVWICYPWEATDIDEHDRLAAKQAQGTK